jgi:methanol--5-hydroxybenzimidazolylcobamide Co-methyltransferase
MRERARFPLAIQNPSGLLFGIAPKPLLVGRGLLLGGGTVHPEIHFTLPPMTVDDGSWKGVTDRYRRIIDAVLARARSLELPGLMVEFEHLPAMTEKPARGAEITALLREALEGARNAFGLASALRVTIVDLRDRTRPLRLRDGPAWEAMRESWRLCAKAGADILSVESVGGKEVHDPALTHGDVEGIAFALGVLAPRDMEWLWTGLTAAAGEATPGSDSACNFANTAMDLARQKLIPDVLAAVVRAMGAARSLVAYECGARGPSKDCAYEGNVLKAVVGGPIAMAGKSAACAHFSILGNIATMAADLCSNKSVPDVRLLSGGAPEACLEMLAYDCRLLNAAAARGRASVVRDLLVESDEQRNPQAFVLGPAASLLLARVIVQHAGDDCRRTLSAGRAALGLLEEASGDGRLQLPPAELRWIDRVGRAFDEIPNAADQLLARAGPRYRNQLDPANYGL